MENKKTALIVTTVGSTVDQFVMPSIRLLLEMGYNVEVACNFHGENTCTDLQINRMKQRFDEMGVKYHQIDYYRNILRIGGILKGRKQLKQILSQKRYDLIHCHTPIAGAVIRLLANKYRKAGQTKVVYTAHGFHFYKGSSLPTWLVFYPIEKFCARFTDVMITINEDDYKLAKRKMKVGKLVYIPGIGIDVEGIQQKVLKGEEREKFKKELGLGTKTMFLSVGELNKNKNHRTVITALGKLKSQDPNLDWHYFICGKGKLKEELTDYAKTLGIDDRITFTGFIDGIVRYYSCADLFIFPSFREGLSVAMMEAIAAGTPVICSDIRGDRELVVQEARFKPNDSDKIYELIKTYLDKKTAEAEVEANRKLLEKCRIENVTKLLREVYEGL